MVDLFSFVDYRMSRHWMHCGGRENVCWLSCGGWKVKDQTSKNSPPYVSTACVDSHSTRGLLLLYFCNQLPWLLLRVMIIQGVALIALSMNWSLWLSENQ